MTQKEISEIIHVEKSSLVQMIDYLMKSGYVEEFQIQRIEGKTLFI
ncbi:MAG: MarR family transcriptional regulator [Sphingobacteriaceae bacterium]|nr:MarR family transcriptional regulator [Sphingobacteriaceae bacterium]